MKKLVEFKLHAGAVPYFIGERCPFIDGPRYIGVTRDDEECYVPLNTLLAITGADFIARVVTTSIIKSIDDDVPTFYTAEEKQVLAEQWLAANL